MTTYLTHKSQIIPSDKQKERLWEISNQCRLMYNLLLNERLDNWKAIREHINNTGCEDKHNHKSDCEFTYITKFDQYQTLKEHRNHTCTENCGISWKFHDFQLFQADYLDMSSNALVDQDIKSWFGLRKKGNDKARPPNFKRFGWFNPIKTRNSGIKILDDNTIQIANDELLKFKLKTPWYGFVKRQEKSRGIKFENIKNVLISYDDIRDRYIVNLQCQFSEIPDYKDNGKYLAIDLGLNNLVAWINSHAAGTGIIKNKRFEKYWNPKYSERMSKRDMCLTTYVRSQTGETLALNHHPNRCQREDCTHKKSGWKVWKRSNKWFYYNNHIKSIRRKMSNQFKDWQHWVSHFIIENTRANTIILGKLDVKSMGMRPRGKGVKDKKSLNNRLLNHGSVTRFVELLTYKAELVGKKVVKINERNTTKCCWNCGYDRFVKDAPNTHGNIECKNCSITTDRDTNGAINIMAKFLDSEWKKVHLAEPQITRDEFLATVKETYSEI